MNQVAEFRGRGIQESDVFAAADALLAEGLRPTIERVRQKIGRGSPNTVSPMLERWFASLGARVFGTASTTSTDAPADSVPASVRNAAQSLWDLARREAHTNEQISQASTQEDLRLREEALTGAQALLAQREEAFAQTRSSLDAALAAAQHGGETTRQQLRDQAQEARRERGELEAQILRLNAQLGQALERHEAARHSHDHALAAKEQDLRQAEERHVQQDKRMLLEVDRARQAIKTLEADLAQEQRKRQRGEEDAIERLQAEQARALQQADTARALEVTLRDQLAAQATELARARTEASVAQLEVEALRSRNEDEKAAHEATRQLLMGSLAGGPKGSDERRPVRVKRPASRP